MWWSPGVATLILGKLCGTNGSSPSINESLLASLKDDAVMYVVQVGCAVMKGG